MERLGVGAHGFVWVGVVEIRGQHCIHICLDASVMNCEHLATVSAPCDICFSNAFVFINRAVHTGLSAWLPACQSVSQSVMGHGLRCTSLAPFPHLIARLLAGSGVPGPVDIDHIAGRLQPTS